MFTEEVLVQVVQKQHKFGGSRLNSSQKKTSRQTGVGNERRKLTQLTSTSQKDWPSVWRWESSSVFLIFSQLPLPFFACTVECNTMNAWSFSCLPISSDTWSLQRDCIYFNFYRDTHPALIFHLTRPRTPDVLTKASCQLYPSGIPYVTTTLSMPFPSLFLSVAFNSSLCPSVISWKSSKECPGTLIQHH